MQFMCCSILFSCLLLFIDIHFKYMQCNSTTMKFLCGYGFLEELDFRKCLMLLKYQNLAKSKFLSVIFCHIYTTYLTMSAILEPGYLNSPDQIHLSHNILFSSGLSGARVSMVFLSTDPKQLAPFRHGVP